VERRYPWVMQQMRFMRGDPEIEELLK